MADTHQKIKLIGAIEMTIREIHKKYEAIGYLNNMVVFLCRCCGKQMVSDLSINKWLSLGDDEIFNFKVA